MSGYTPLFSEIVTSSIWNEDDTVRIVWITLMALAEADGTVMGSACGLAPVARVSIEECEKAIQILSSPDKYSRSQEKEGRRIEKIDGGFQLVNLRKYRDKAKSRAEYYRKWRQENKTSNIKTNTNLNINTNINSETARNTPEHSATVAPLVSFFEEVRKLYPGTKRGNLTEFENFMKQHKDWRTVILLLKPAVEAQIAWRENANGEFRPPWKHFRTWINQRCWEDESGKKQRNVSSYGADTGVCVVCREPGVIYKADQCKRRIWLCEVCCKAFGGGNWGIVPLDQIERIVGIGKANAANRSHAPPGPGVNEIRNEQRKGLLGDKALKGK